MPARIDVDADPVALLDGVPLSADEAGYVEAVGGEHAPWLPLRLAGIHRLVSRE